MFVFSCGSTDDATQIRRVRLPRICNAQTGAISYDELVGLAISFVIPEQPVHASDFQVKLTYKDVDDDLVVIGSSEELMDALDQYKEQRVLRITAEVKRSTRAPALLPPASVPSRASTNVESNPGAQSDGANAGVSAPVGSTETPVLQGVVESVVNIILNAAVAINSRGQAATDTTTIPVYDTEGVMESIQNASNATPAVTDPPTETVEEAAVAAPPASAPEPVQDLVEAPQDTTKTPQAGPTDPVPLSVRACAAPLPHHLPRVSSA